MIITNPCQSLLHSRQSNGSTKELEKSFPTLILTVSNVLLLVAASAANIQGGPKKPDHF